MSDGNPVNVANMSCVSDRCGVTFFNFGGSCVVRLLVALHTLRKHYNGPVTIFLAKDDRFNEASAVDIGKFGNIQWFDLGSLAKRNLKCVLKPSLFEMSPYEHTIMCDGDMLFQGSPSHLFASLVEKGFLVTKFSTWNTDGKKMRARIEKFRGLMSPEDFATAGSQDPKRGKFPAINIGVMGWSKGCPEVLKTWKDRTMAVAGHHMADEHAAQVTFPFFPTAVMGTEWNESCVFPVDPKYSSSKVLHYHGNKHSDPKRLSSRLWLAALQDLMRSRKCPGLAEYLFWGDDAVLSNLSKLPEFFDPAVIYDPAKGR